MAGQAHSRQVKSQIALKERLSIASGNARRIEYKAFSLILTAILGVQRDFHVYMENKMLRRAIEREFEINDEKGL